jgi:hypothetical protein
VSGLGAFGDLRRDGVLVALDDSEDVEAVAAADEEEEEGTHGMGGVWTVDDPDRSGAGQSVGRGAKGSNNGNVSIS